MRCRRAILFYDKGRMRVESCAGFFGIPRNSEICFPSIRENVLAHIPAGSEVQCFYHLYKIDEIRNPRSGSKVN